MQKKVDEEPCRFTFKCPVCPVTLWELNRLSKYVFECPKCCKPMQSEYNDQRACYIAVYERLCDVCDLNTNYGVMNCKKCNVDVCNVCIEEKILKKIRVIE